MSRLSNRNTPHAHSAKRQVEKDAALCYCGGMQKWLIVCVPCALLLLGRCAGHRATPEEAKAFIDAAEQKLLDLNNDAQRADWIKDTYITDDTEAVAAIIDERAINATVGYAKESTRFDGLTLDPVTARKIKLLKLSLTIPTPNDPKESEELTRIAAGRSEE